MTQHLTVIIDAQLPPGGRAGGIEQFVIGLVHALGKLNDGPEEYVIVSHWDHPDWLEQYRGPNQRIVAGRQPRTQPESWEAVKRLLGPLREPTGYLWRAGRRLILGPPRQPLAAVPESDGFYEAFDGHVVHFPYQAFVRCTLPTIYNPHDLQHLHYPQFWSQEIQEWREAIYRAGCRSAQAVVAESEWVKEDIVRQYGVDPRKVYAIARGSPTEVYEPITDESLADVKKRFSLPETFVLYPAQTWAHKNHIRLLEAIASIRQRHGQCLNLVCTGRRNDFWPTIEQRLHDLRLENQVQFLGFVGQAELRALYQLTQFVVFPSLFEGGGFPVVEGFHEGAPVACSAVTSLPEYGGDAVLLFDPTSVESIAQAMFRMAKDSELRDILRKRGTVRAGMFRWDRTAKAYRALYRKVAGYPLSEEEQHLLLLAGQLRPASTRVV